MFLKIENKYAEYVITSSEAERNANYSIHDGSSGFDRREQVSLHFLGRMNTTERHQFAQRRIRLSNAGLNKSGWRDRACRWVNRLSTMTPSRMKSFAGYADSGPRALLILINKAETIVTPGLSVPHQGPWIATARIRRAWLPLDWGLNWMLAERSLIANKPALRIKNCQGDADTKEFHFNTFLPYKHK